MIMKLSELQSHDATIRERQDDDPEYAAEAERLALAGAVSLAVVRYRAQHNLTQTAFGSMLNWKQPQVARLERGDAVPSLDSLQRLARVGVIEVHIDQQATYVRALAAS